MIQRSLILLLIGYLSCNLSFGQAVKNVSNFQMPLTGVLGVTGSFGEIRPDHFHSGVDLRTDNRIGKEVRAVSDGFISRIYVSPVGFGKAIYVDHPNGVTSVYAHLDSFYPEADKYLKKYQYQNKTYSVDLFPNADVLPIKKGDLLGYSGNSGGSFGPHLHYELRTTFDQRPMNPVPDYLNIIDTIAPIIRSLHIFRIDSSSFVNGYERKKDISVFKNQKSYTINTPVNAYGKVGVGIDVYDKLNSLSTNCGFKSVNLTVNGKTIYNLILDKFSYAETRYANSIIDYATIISTGKEIIKLFVDPANYYSGLRRVINKGLIDITPDSIYHIDIKIEDSSKNLTYLSFTIKGVNPPVRIANPISTDKTVIYIPCMMDKLIFNDTFTLFIPKITLYDNLYFAYSFTVSPLSLYSPIIHLHNKLTPLHQKVKFSITGKSIPTKYQSKALLATFDASNKPIAAGGEWINGQVKGLISTLGDYFIAIDTIAPTIRPINISSGSKMTNSKTIKFEVKDEFSGIKSIDGYIDNEWVLFEYDKKNDLITYFFDKERVKTNVNHTFKLVVKDNKDNNCSYSCEFYW